MLKPLLNGQGPFFVASEMDSASCQKWAERQSCVVSVWDVWRRTSKVHLAWQAQCKRHNETYMSQTCSEVGEQISWEGSHFGASDLRVFPKMILRDKCRLFRGRRSAREMGWKKHKTQWHEALSLVLNFPCLKKILQNCFGFDVDNFDFGRSLELRISAFNFQISTKAHRTASFSILQKDR